jgi:hypothetical protein
MDDYLLEKLGIGLNTYDPPGIVVRWYQGALTQLGCQDL